MRQLQMVEIRLLGQFRVRQRLFKFRPWSRRIANELELPWM